MGIDSKACFHGKQTPYLIKMTRIQPQTVADKLTKEINEFLDEITHTDSYNKVVFAKLIKQAIELQGKGCQVIEGCVLRSTLYSGSGQFSEAEKMFANIRANNGHAQARAAQFHHLVNHGFASEALKHADLFFTNCAHYNFVEIAELVMSAGGFNKVVEKLAISQRNQEVLKMTTTVLEIAKQGGEVLTLLEVSDAQIAAMLDLAGEILRANKLYWQGHMPDMHVLLPENGGPALMYDYRVFVSPQESARMNWELTETLVGHDLDIPGIHIGFVGTDMPAKLAA